MSVQFDSKSASVDFATSLTWNHTVTSLGSGRILLVGVSLNGTSTPLVTAITFAGDSMTQVTGALASSSQESKDVWYLLNPKVGAGAFVVTTSGSVNHGAASAACYNGVDVSSFATASGSIGTASGSSGAVSQNVTSQVGELVVDFIMYSSNSSGGGGSLTPDAGQTEITEIEVGSGSIFAGASGSYKSGAASVDMNWSYSVSAGGVRQVSFALHSAPPAKQRLIQYFTNTYRNRDAGRLIIEDAYGREIPVEQLGVDAFMRADGPAFPTTYKFASNIDDPSVFYIEAASIRGDSVQIKTNKQSLLESLLGRLGGRSI